MKNLLLKALPFIDIILVPLVYPAAFLLKLIRRAGVHRLEFCKRALMKVGVFPVLNHYYEPQFDNRKLKVSLSKDRKLKGIDWNINGQLELLNSFRFSKELSELQKSKPNSLEFYLENDSFKSGDAEYWYQIIRSTKPKRIIEIGSGNSTLMAVKAIKKNREEDAEYECEHICIEPFEMPWLEEINVSVMRKRVEEVELSFFSKLTDNDILFIDSSHIIRPQGDVLFEYLELIPSLNKGVIVHIHDIFSPKDYLQEWVVDEVKFWNEQYLLEAFLTNNNSWEIIGALNFLHHNHSEEFKEVAPYVTPEREPGSFYIRKIN